MRAASGVPPLAARIHFFRSFRIGLSSYEILKKRIRASGGVRRPMPVCVFSSINSLVWIGVAAHDLKHIGVLAWPLGRGLDRQASFAELPLERLVRAQHAHREDF